MAFEHTCLTCGMAFVSDRRNSKYCSRECASTAKIGAQSKKKGVFSFDHNRLCVQCGNSYVSRERYSKYCSRECYYISEKGHVHTDDSKKKMSKSKMGHTVTYETRHKISVSKKGQRVSQATEFKNGQSPWNVGKKGTHFSPTTEFKKGKDHPDWKGGISFDPYCPDFNVSLKEKIRDRDNRTCQMCGIKENGNALSVHHVHYDKDNCTPDLISLCSSCHSKTNRNRDYYEALFMEKLEERGLLS